MTSVKAKLTVVLKADDVIVAEAEDAVLWQRVLTALNRGSAELLGDADLKGLDGGTEKDKLGDDPQKNTKPGSAPIDLFARQLGIERAVLEGGCSPSPEQPYIRLDLHCWEEMKKQIPDRGPGSPLRLPLPPHY